MIIRRIRCIAFLLFLCAFLNLIGCSNEGMAQEFPKETSDVTIKESLSEPNNKSSDEKDDGKEKNFDFNHGSAVTLEGKVILVSIFTNDSSTKWDYNSDADRKTIDSSLINLKIAANYLSQQVLRFDKQVSFVYDWETNNDLVYYADFDSELVRTDGIYYLEQQQWLMDNVDAFHLLEKYDADNIIFIFFFNTDYSNQVNPWSLGRANGEDIIWEFANFYLKYQDYDMPPASYAHEIMHAFGAHDLYYANEFIPQTYVDHLSDTASNDIMFTTSLSTEIIEEFSNLDAYYVGIAPRPKEADQWSLSGSEHNPD